MIFIILFFIYGLVIGSFCNVVIYRLHSGESIVLKKSHCPRCNTPIAWRDNVPVFGYMMLRGKCRSCAQKISIQYPLVEIAMGVIFASVGFFVSTGAVSSLLTGVLYALGFACLVVIFVYDLKYMEIPMSVMWLCIGFFLGGNVAIDVYTGFGGDVWSSTTVLHMMSAAVAFCFFFGLSYVSDETWMGYGDAFIAIVIGLLLGPIGTFLALLIAFCVGAIYGVGLMFIKNKSSKTEIPFGPFLIFGLYVVFVVQSVVPDFIEYFF